MKEEEERKMDRGTEHDGSHAPTGDLAALLECERELAELMAEAHEEAGRRVAEARAEVARAEATLEASLEEAGDRVRSEVRERAQERVRQVLSEAGERAAAFERVTDAEVERLADRAFRSLIGEEASS